MRKIILYSLLLLLVSCKKNLDSTADKISSITPIKSLVAAQAIPSIKIGTQTWMKYNLAVTIYRNGDLITYMPYVKGNTTWSTTTAGAYCYYSNDISNANTYGFLYNLIAINDPRSLAPKGWHIPSINEWQTLAIYAGGTYYKAGGPMKAVSALWKSPNSGATNSSGFTGLPGGYRNSYKSGSFLNLSVSGIWGTTTHTSNNKSYYVSILVNSSAGWNDQIYSPNDGVSVRCIKD